MQTRPLLQVQELPEAMLGGRSQLGLGNSRSPAQRVLARPPSASTLSTCVERSQGNMVPVVPSDDHDITKYPQSTGAQSTKQLSLCLDSGVGRPQALLWAGSLLLGQLGVLNGTRSWHGFLCMPRLSGWQGQPLLDF